MRVLKASAGSGKTHELSKTYLDLLLESEDRYAYRHILAVTFTNKATAEMKSRILRDLYNKSKEDKKAEQILRDILHDYSAFAVSTIDRFFQQALKAFSREIGQFASYQVELDRDSLIQESMDRILDGLTEDQTELIEWLRSSAMDKIEQGDKFSIDEGLLEIGKRLKSEDFRNTCRECGIDPAQAFSKERLSAIRTTCRKVIRDFESKAEAAGLDVKKGKKLEDPGVRKKKDREDLEELFGKPYDEYSTAFEIDGLIYSLGLAGEFRKQFDALLKEKNVMPLDDSNTILRDIIGGSDAPFIYEKLGVRYEHFLLDEFQDTSRVQWDNFLPLLHESEANSDPEKTGNLIVGDVKQSIYRFRDSDWRLLGQKVGEEFPKAKTEVMGGNWRSAPAVVNFNNRFFKFAEEKLNTGLYSDVGQTPMKNEDGQEGCVEISFTKDILELTIDSIKGALERGANYSDIAILVRGRKEGKKVADALIKEGLPVITDDSLAIKSSATVRRLVSLLSSMDNPQNTVGSYLSKELGVEYPEHHHSLLDLSETLLRSLRDYDRDSFEGETLFIQAFMDDLRSWVEANGNNLRSYLKHWEGVDPCIGSPEDAESVRILTIHKSKGLEFPYVIFPFAEQVELYTAGVRWCKLEEEIYPVKLSKKLDRSLFADALEQEMSLQTVDNMNIFYVALTRAKKELHVISAEPSQKFCKALAKGNQEYMRLSEILFEFTNKSYHIMYGQPYDFSKMKRDVVSDITDFPAGYPSFTPENRLKASEDAADYFGEDGVTGAAASARLCGIEMHRTMEKVRTAEDLPGSLSAPDRALLEERIKAHPQWFQGGTVRNEVTLINTDGEEYRPDRVIIDGDSVFVLDYKFGTERKNSYKNQVRNYMDLYRRMGYKNVAGAVWYVSDDTVIEV